MKKKFFLLFLMFVFAFGCETISGESRSDGKFNSLLQKEAETYANFCTGFYLMLEYRWEEAVEIFKKALQSDPNAEKIHSLLATCYFQLDKKEEALSHIEKVAQLKPNDFGIHYMLGSIYENEGEEEKAIFEYERSNKCVSEGVNGVYIADMLHRLANLYLKTGDLEKAANVCKKILDSNLINEPVKIHYKLGQIYFERKMFKEATDEFLKARDCDSNFGSVSFYLASCYEELEDYEKAITELKSFVGSHTEVWLVHISLSNIYEKVKQYEMAELESKQALRILKKSIKKGSKNLREYIVLSQLFQKKDENSKAIETLNTAIQNAINEDNEALKEIHFLLANMYYEMNDYENVVKEIEEVLLIDPDSHQANNFLGYFFVERGEKLDEALSLIKKALGVEPRNGAYLDSLGWAYYKIAGEGDQEKMVLALQKLIEASKYTEEPEIMDHIGDVYYCLGFWEEAQKQWEIALRLWENVTEKFPPYLKHKITRERRVMKIVLRKLEKLHHLKMVEDSKERVKSEKKIVSNRIQ